MRLQSRHAASFSNPTNSRIYQQSEASEGRAGGQLSAARRGAWTALFLLLIELSWSAWLVPAPAAREAADWQSSSGRRSSGPTKIYIVNASSDVSPQAWGGHWNKDVFNACVDVLRQHVTEVARYYHPQGVELVVAGSGRTPKGWKATFRSGGTGGYHGVAGRNSMAVAYTGSLLHTFSPCTVMGEEIAEMVGNPKPGSACYTAPNGQRIQPEIVDPIWGSGYCPVGYEPECADTVAGSMPGFVLPSWFANRRGALGISTEMTYPAGVVDHAWEKTPGGEYYRCG